MAAPVIEGWDTFSGAPAWPYEIELPVPAGTAEGEKLLAFIWSGPRAVADTDSFHDGAGSYEFYGDATSGHDIYCFSRTAGASEPASYTFTASGTGTFFAAMVRISSHNGIDGSTPAANTGTSNSPTAPSITCSAADTLVFHMGGAANYNPSNPFADDVDPEDYSGVTAGTVCYNLSHNWYAAGATGTKVWTLTGADYWAAGSVAVAPAAAGGTKFPGNPLHLRSPLSGPVA